MPKRTLESLGAMIKTRRGEKSLKKAADEIGVSSATLLRVENGHTPDIHTFAKLCKWIDVDPGEFLGFKPSTVDSKRLVLSAHLRADRTPQQATVQALAQMIKLAAEMEAGETAV